MKEGISFYPKSHLLSIISGLVKSLHSIGVKLRENSHDTVLALEEVEGVMYSEETIVMYLTANKVLEDIQADDNEVKTLEAEVELHQEAYSNEYQKITDIIAKSAVDDMLKKMGFKERGDKDGNE